MASEKTDLLKAFLVDKLRHPLPRRQLAGVVLFFDAIFAATEFQLGTLRAKAGDLLRHRCCLGAFSLGCHFCSGVRRILEGFDAI
jgi:hypothetical protein